MAKYPRREKREREKKVGWKLVARFSCPSASSTNLPQISSSLPSPYSCSFCIPSDSWRILMHGTCAIWQCRPVYRGFIVGPKGSRPNRQKFLYLHSCVFITPSPPSRYVVRSMNLNCELPAVFCFASGKNPLRKTFANPFHTIVSRTV